MKLAGAIALAAALAAVIAGAAHASDPYALRGYGTAAVDGVLSPGEWDPAGHSEFMANRSPAEGGGTVPATLMVMNDATNLYLALRVAVTTLDNSTFDSLFPGSTPFAPGSDILRVVPWTFEDSHWHQTGPSSWEWAMDLTYGGTQDGTSSVQVSNGVAVFEVSHPLDSLDDLHDFSLIVPSHVSYVGLFQHCIAGSCAFTNFTPDPRSKIVIVSGTHVPPETTITAGPAEGAEIPDYGTFEFAGVDDVAPAGEITFECKVDTEPWDECERLYGPATTVEGWHTLSVRALDDMLNADPTPAQRRWRIDTVSPSKPRATRTGRTTFRFSATDRGTPSRRLRFRCAIDSKRLHACASRVRARLPARRHVLRVSAADPAGNESDVKVVRFTVRRSG
jgi:hypothetical protein